LDEQTSWKDCARHSNWRFKAMNGMKEAKNFFLQLFVKGFFQNQKEKEKEDKGVFLLHQYDREKAEGIYFCHLFSFPFIHCYWRCHVQSV
jgi:hypothetical protein